MRLFQEMVLNEYKLEDENDIGYSNLMDNTNNDNIEMDKTKHVDFNINTFNGKFNNKKSEDKYSNDIIEYKEPEALLSNGNLNFSDLGVSKIDDFSVNNNSCFPVEIL